MLVDAEVLQSAPASEPVTLQEAKDHCRVEVSTDDTFITNLIVTARGMVEAFTRRALITQTWDFWLDFFPCDDRIKLPRPPLSSVSFVKYYDTDAVLQTMSSSDYQVDDKKIRGAVVLKYNAQWPTTEYGRINAVNVRAICGYGNAAAVPQQLKQAILVTVDDLYNNRGSILIGTISAKLPIGAQILAMPYRVGALA